MSGGYEVVLDRIEAACGAARRAADVVKPVDLAGALAGVAPGLSGGTSGEAARLLADAWRTAVPDWVRNSGEYSEQLDGSVRLYRSNEQAAVHDLRAAATRGTRGPV